VTRKLILKLVVSAIAMLGWASLASASPLTENLQNATFYDGGVATGFFIFETASSSITDWSISVSGGNTGTFPALIYTPANSVASAGAGDLGFPLTGFSFGLNDFSRYLALLLESSLPLGGGADPFHIWPNGEAGHSYGFECLNCTPFRNLATGSVVGAAVPEPGSVALVGLGLAAFALRRRK
jgi:hypothetical protein